jgi:hypothetical protein
MRSKPSQDVFSIVDLAKWAPQIMKREAGGQGEFFLCPQGKVASPRFMGVIVLGDA